MCAPRRSTDQARCRPAMGDYASWQAARCTPIQEFHASGSAINGADAGALALQFGGLGLSRGDHVVFERVDQPVY